MKIKNTLARFACLSLVLPFACALGATKEVRAEGGSHTHNNISFTEWTSSDSLPDIPGNYCLTQDILLNDTWNTPEGTTNLCLNGYVIGAVPKLEDLEDIIYVDEDCVLNIYDCNETKTNYFKDEVYNDGFDDHKYWLHDNSLAGTENIHSIVGGAINGCTYRPITVNAMGTLNLYNGTICKGDSQLNYGGAVYVYGGTFNMYGGTLTDNLSFYGGAIFVYGEPDNKAKFNMYGGKIVNNTTITEDEEGYGGGISTMYADVVIEDGLISNNISGGLGGGIQIGTEATVTMNGGTVSNNRAYQGGGVCVGEFYYSEEVHGRGEFIFNGGSIIDNIAIDDGYGQGGAGGGVYVLDGSTFKANGGTISNNKADYAGGGVYLSMPYGQDPYYCVAEGTMVTLDDGSKEAIEDLEAGWQTLRTFDHETGELTSSDIYYIEKNENVTENVITLNFSNDIDVTIIGGHTFFNKEANKYVTITPSNVSGYIGKNFYNADEARWETLEGSTVVNEPVTSYSLVTSGTINFVTNGMLSCGDELYEKLVNIFDYGEDLKYDATKKAADIETYGIFELEDAQFASEATYNALSLKYLKVAMGKGIITAEYLKEAALYQSYQGSGLVTNGLAYFGGTVNVIDNVIGTDTPNNVHVWANKGTQKIVVGTGETGNKVAKPVKGQMSVGVSLYQRDEIEEDVFENNRAMGKISINGTAEDAECFFTDDPTKIVSFKEDYLEIRNPSATVPNIQTKTFAYDGTEKNFGIPTNDAYTIEGPVKGTEVGEYKVKLILKNKAYASWTDGKTDDIEYTFTINQKVAVPSIEEKVFTYDGTEKTFQVPTNDAYTIEGALKGTEVGEYKVKLVLKDKEYTSWTDGSTDDVEITFVINQRAADVEVVYEGETPDEVSPVSIIDADLGIAPEAVLVVKVVKLESEDDIKNSKDALNNENKIAEDEAIFGCYDAKLLLNNVEIQPSGTIKIKMQIPDEIRGKDFKLYHIHTGEPVIEITYDIVEENGYLIFETDKLSQFAFIGKVPTNPTPDGDPTCIVHWFMIAVLIIGVALFVVFELLFNKKLMSCIESGAALLISIILAIIGRCTVCIVFKIICLVIFALLLALAFFRKRGDDDNKEEEKEEQPVQPVEEEKPAENADVAQANEESVEPEASEKDEGLSLKSSFAALAAAGGAKKFSKKFISEYLEKNYKDSTELNCRENATKPGKGQTVGLPLADTHYVKGKNSKKCFIYVYEKDEGVLVLANINEEYAEQLKKTHELVSRSAFPKSQDGWYSIILDSSWEERDVGELLDNLIKSIKM